MQSGLRKPRPRRRPGRCRRAIAQALHPARPACSCRGSGPARRRARRCCAAGRGRDWPACVRSVWISWRVSGEVLCHLAIASPGAQLQLERMQAYERARAVLRKHFGYDDFRGAQKDAITSILSGRDTLVLMPTGGGKSLCFQIPAMVLDGPTLVISPLISLMKDQVDNACRAGVPATFVNSTLPYEEVQTRLRGVRTGKF